MWELFYLADYRFDFMFTAAIASYKIKSKMVSDQRENYFTWPTPSLNLSTFGVEFVHNRSWGKGAFIIVSRCGYLSVCHYMIWAAPCDKNFFGRMRTAKAQISLRIRKVWSGFHCPLTESLDTTECMNEEQMLGWYFAHVQANLNVQNRRHFFAWHCIPEERKS